VYDDVPREAVVVDGHLVDDRERRDLARGLKQRHVQMIAIAGAIVRKAAGWSSRYYLDVINHDIG
jgi:hypothetical protein